MSKGTLFRIKNIGVFAPKIKLKEFRKMNKSQTLLHERAPKMPTKKDITVDSTILFPFDGTLQGNENEIVTKILFVMNKESVYLPNIGVEPLAKHIKSILADESKYDILKAGELNDEYFEIVEKIAVGHGVKNNPKYKESNLISFSSKFCGHHNQKAPFYDNLCYELVKYWINDKLQERNYRQYVDALKQLQKKQKLEAFSLRNIESYMWQIGKKVFG
jgi:hypothetical protein